jgi:hypothetical protein
MRLPSRGVTLTSATKTVFFCTSRDQLTLTFFRVADFFFRSPIFRTTPQSNSGLPTGVTLTSATKTVLFCTSRYQLTLTFFEFFSCRRFFFSVADFSDYTQVKLGTTYGGDSNFGHQNRAFLSKSRPTDSNFFVDFFSCRRFSGLP